MSSTIATVRFLLLWSLYFSPALANNGGSGHPHQGKVTPFEPGDPNVKLDGKAEGILKNGNPFQVGYCHLYNAASLVRADHAL